jgi:hypothetical protein
MRELSGKCFGEVRRLENRVSETFLGHSVALQTVARYRPILPQGVLLVT